MRVIGFIGTVFAFVFFANLAYAKTVEIDMLNKDGYITDKQAFNWTNPF